MVVKVLKVESYRILTMVGKGIQVSLERKVWRNKDLPVRTKNIGDCFVGLVNREESPGIYKNGFW